MSAERSRIENAAIAYVLARWRHDWAETHLQPGGSKSARGTAITLGRRELISWHDLADAVQNDGRCEQCHTFSCSCAPVTATDADAP